jgi:hypothetical protein
MPAIEQMNPLGIQLDPYNPRLSAEEEGSDQAQLIQVMIRRFKIEELAESILESGYLPFDPLVGYRTDGSVVVREGNRRIAALKLLLNPTLAPERNQARWDELSRSLSTEKREGLEIVEIQVYDDPENIDLTTYLGFRHVTGALKWPALEKASFMAELVQQGWDYRSIAKRIGSYGKHVERHYVAFQVVQQSTTLEISGAEFIRQRFGVLLRALQTPGIRNFIGVAYPDDPERSREPVPTEREQEFRDFVKWTFGTDDVGPVVSDSRQLSDWGQILESPEALSYLRRSSRPSFERAWFRSGGQAQSVAESLFIAADHLQEVVPLVSALTDKSEVRAGFGQCARFFRQVLTHFPDIGREYGLDIDD